MTRKYTTSDPLFDIERPVDWQDWRLQRHHPLTQSLEDMIDWDALTGTPTIPAPSTTTGYRTTYYRVGRAIVTTTYRVVRTTGPWDTAPDPTSRHRTSYHKPGECYACLRQLPNDYTVCGSCPDPISNTNA